MHQGAPAGTVVIAQTQTQGRGQQGRPWASAPGGIYLSLGLRPDILATEGARLTLGCGWGVATVFQAEGISVGLKWPNDLLLAGKKLGGILTESRVRGDRIHQAIVGVGLNWRNLAPEPGISLQPFLGKQNSLRITCLETAIAFVLKGLVLGCQRWQYSPISLKQLLDEYEKLVKLVDRPVQVGSEWGTITGITTAGELKVDLVEALDPVKPDFAARVALPSSRRSLVFPPGAIKLGYD
ncbi:MAG: biotin--[acetyl-CoA-carboxylase] ligase [Synechococcales cyanobacterium CRU_2_2]|nr:biotin--[acetyl-CoA-carboxylase] ligase [Synechococcales cyanobacterium CRU_2_2]